VGETDEVESVKIGQGVTEQITDRAIEELEDDLLGHQDFVDRLLTIIQSTETPANIALFGRWGSGKTGIANRLRREVAEVSGFRFAYFDAFKFARLPLLRQFLIRLAQELGGKTEAKRYRHLLYERTERVDLDSERPVKPALWKWGLRLLYGLVAAIWLFDLLAIFVFSAEQTGVLLGLIGAVFPVLLPTGLVAIAAGAAARYLTVTTTVESPSSDEEFEVLFSQLLEEQQIGPKAGQETLVVFVDELDRASPVEVARTLESIKTFLGEKGCIFVVGADRVVLEHALTLRVRQATPRDLTNPYYSAGSAYLDKIFSYQINLPPLFPGRLTGFASKLLDNQGGVWDQVSSRDDVISVLLPVTVRSPRRVKVLLNAFAQAFAIVLARAGDHGLDPNIADRASEVAKLVCLQVEFPLFAADLPIAGDLPGLVLDCVDALADDEDPRESEALQGIPDFVTERAIAYAECKLPTDESLGQDHGEDQRMRSSQGGDLIDYLRQTELINGPLTDLVHLEGLGFSTGLEEALAIELNNLALTNRSELVRKRIESLDDEAEKQRALLRLRDLVRESRGIDSDNAIRALLVAFPAVGSAMQSVAHDLLAAVVRYDRDRGLDTDELPSALELAIIGESKYLQRAILERKEVLVEPLRGHVIDRAAVLIDDHAARLGQVLLEDLLADPKKSVSRLLA
jgi:KAP family P-loop domain